MLKQFSSIFELFAAFPDEQSAIDHLRAIRWRKGAYCPHCGGTRIMHFKDNRTHKCSDCRQRFSIKVGTIFEDTKLPLRKWFAAIWLITNHPKGIASTQLATELGITQKSAWFVLHRLRYAARTKSFARPLAGSVECDETLVGGREANKHKRKRNSRAKGASSKTIVMGILERNGELRAKVVPDLKAKTLQAEVRANVEPGANVMTDQLNSYVGLRADYVHQSVNHWKEEFVRGDVHVNGIEGVWSLFKRQYHGTHHWISPKHMDAYVGELCYRWNRRELAPGERVNALLAQAEGRLTYKALIA
ncbi:IS1595 family transposase [Terricaulis sp.]|uniref:IS1595 family transposase n=1 Tax=Terricaulis sp. TaxID=2768686 RepID=UPI002AC4FF77|nr:IS1595 family transposase [Terricaulis sp.]MDZ4692856.1 IS1595 family transposase [Terricaulis sp.]